MRNTVVRLLASIILVSSVLYAKLASADAINKNSKNSSLQLIKNFEKKYPNYVKKLMKQVENKINNASHSGGKGISMFIMDLNGFHDIKNCDSFRNYLELKLKSLHYKVKRSYDYIEIYW